MVASTSSPPSSLAKGHIIVPSRTFPPPNWITSLTALQSAKQREESHEANKMTSSYSRARAKRVAANAQTPRKPTTKKAVQSCHPIRSKNTTKSTPIANNQKKALSTSGKRSRGMNLDGSFKETLPTQNKPELVKGRQEKITPSILT